MSEKTAGSTWPEGVKLIDVVLNELAFRSLNNVPYEPSPNVAEAIDGLGNWVRKGSMALTLALLEVADAMRERGAE